VGLILQERTDLFNSSRSNFSIRVTNNLCDFHATRIEKTTTFTSSSQICNLSRAREFRCAPTQTNARVRCKWWMCADEYARTLCML